MKMKMKMKTTFLSGNASPREVVGPVPLGTENRFQWQPMCRKMELDERTIQLCFSSAVKPV